MGASMLEMSCVVQLDEWSRPICRRRWRSALSTVENGSPAAVRMLKMKERRAAGNCAPAAVWTKRKIYASGLCGMSLVRNDHCTPIKYQ